MTWPQVSVFGGVFGIGTAGLPRTAQPNSSSVVVKLPSGGPPPTARYEGGSDLRMRGIVRAGGVPKLAPLTVTAPCSSANVAAGDAGAETIVGVSGIAFAPADAGNAPNPLLTITVKIGA